MYLTRTTAGATIPARSRRRAISRLLVRGSRHGSSSSRRSTSTASRWSSVVTGNEFLDETSNLSHLVAHEREWCMGMDEAADLYRSAQTSLNLYRREANDGATRGRLGGRSTGD